MMQSQEDLANNEEVSSPFSAEMFEFCESELFQETLHSSGLASSSNCGGIYEETNCSYTNSLVLPTDHDIDTFNSSTTTSTTHVNTNNNNVSNLSIIFDSNDDNVDHNDISFSPSPPFCSIPQFLTSNEVDLSLIQQQNQMVGDGFSHYQQSDLVVPRLMGNSLPLVYEDDCLSSVPSYVPIMGGYMNNQCRTMSSVALDNSGFFSGTSFMEPQDLEFQAEIYCPDSMQQQQQQQRVFGRDQSQLQLVSGVGNSVSAPLVSEISSLEDSAFKVGKLSVEQRKEKIHRYIKKRNERNFSKKIKYACRKTLADSRPRVRGRFAKNDEFGEIHRHACSNHEEDDEDEVIVKEEEEMVDSSDIFAHISGVNSFKCNYPIQSWI